MLLRSLLRLIVIRLTRFCFSERARNSKVSLEIGQLTNIYERWKFLCVTLCMSGQEGSKDVACQWTTPEAGKLDRSEGRQVTRRCCL